MIPYRSRKDFDKGFGEISLIRFFRMAGLTFVTSDDFYQNARFEEINIPAACGLISPRDPSRSCKAAGINTRGQ